MRWIRNTLLHFLHLYETLRSPTCDSELLRADADLLLVCSKQNSFPVRAADLKPLTLGLHHLWTWEKGRGRERERDEEKLDVCDHMGSWNYKLVLSGKLLFFIVIFILKNIQCDQATFFFSLELRLLMKELQRHGGCLLMCFLNEILKNSNICLQNCSDGIQTPKQTQIFQLSRYIPDECNSWTNWMDISFLSPSLTFFCFLPKLTVKYMWIFASHYVYNEKIYKCLPLITDDCWNCQGVDIFTNCWWAAADWVMMFSQR